MGNSLRKPSENQESPQQEAEEEAADESFTCEICIEPFSGDKRFKNRNNCSHPFCLDCITKYIQVKIEDHRAIIPCPGLSCQQVLDPLFFRALIPPSVFSKWCDLLCDDYVLGFERSYCPNRNCRALVVNECGGFVKKSKCPSCNRLFCFQCNLAWHAGYGCEESRNMRDPNDILFGQLVERNGWIRCPRCGHCVERRYGCNVIVCRCKANFCYKCGKEFLIVSSSNGCRCNNGLGRAILGSCILLVVMTVTLLLSTMIDVLT